MILPIFLYGSPVLRQKAAAVDMESEDKAALTQFIKDMTETMHKADGCGLAAPQVGVSKRILVVDGNELQDKYPELKGFHREMINPEFTFRSEEKASLEEGCLSIPGVDADVLRPNVIRISYIDADFNPVEEEFTGFAARMVQHEMDHLDGIVFTDHASPIRKKMIAAKLLRISKGKSHPSYKAKLG